MRGSDAVKAAYREVLQKLVEIFLDDLDEPQRHERALALAALCVGGIVTPKCVDDPVLADDLRRAAHRRRPSQGVSGRCRRAVDRHIVWHLLGRPANRIAELGLAKRKCSAYGTKRTFLIVSAMSAFGGKADIDRMWVNVRF